MAVMVGRAMADLHVHRGERNQNGARTTPLAFAAGLLAQAAQLEEQAKAAPPAKARNYQATAVQKLILAELISDEKADAAVKVKAKRILDDAEQSPATKLEIERLSARLDRKDKKYASQGEWLAEREASAVDFIKRYQGQPGGYEELLAVAALSPRERAVAHAQVIVASAAPERIKASARTILRRETIDGKHIMAVIGEAAGGGPFMRQVHNKSAIVYSWSPSDETSLKKAKQIASGAFKGAVIIGINTSRDVPRALACVKSEQLPGDQLYNARGFDSPLAEKLAMNTPGLIYFLSADGVVRNISDTRDMTAMIQTLSKGGN